MHSKQTTESQLQYLLREEIAAPELAERLDSIQAHFTQYLLAAHNECSAHPDAADWLYWLRKLRYAILDKDVPEER